MSWMLLVVSLWTVTIPGEKHKDYNVNVSYILCSSVHLIYSNKRKMEALQGAVLENGPFQVD